MIRTATVLALSALALAACAPAPTYAPSGVPTSYASANDVSAPIITNDSYSPTIKVEAGGGKKTDASANSEIWGLYGRVTKKSGATVAYVQWGEVYADREWRFYNRASTNKGEVLSFETVERKVSKCYPRLGECTYSEAYNIMIPPSLLKTGATDGISFKVYSRNGQEKIVNVPAEIVGQFNGKLAEAQKMRVQSAAR